MSIAMSGFKSLGQKNKKDIRYHGLGLKRLNLIKILLKKKVLLRLISILYLFNIKINL